MKKHATLSPCETYRYWLERSWAETGRGFVNWIMLNPSTADATIDDQTIRKCIAFSRRWGYDGMHVVNLFALRSTDPEALKAHPDPVGPDNNQYIEASILSAERTIVAWGNHGRLFNRDDNVKKMLDRARTFALVTNKDGSPKHPLYCRNDCEPMPWLVREPA